MGVRSRNQLELGCNVEPKTHPIRLICSQGCPMSSCNAKSNASSARLFTPQVSSVIVSGSSQPLKPLQPRHLFPPSRSLWSKPSPRCKRGMRLATVRGRVMHQNESEGRITSPVEYPLHPDAPRPWLQWMTQGQPALQVPPCKAGRPPHSST